MNMSRWALVLAAAAMPVLAWLTQSGRLGGDVGAESSRFPTLLVPASYAFGIWGLIFLLDLLYAGWQARTGRARDPLLARIRPWAAAGFALTASWVPLFTHQLYTAAVVVIWAALAGVLTAAVWCARAETADPVKWPVARVALALHAGWLSLAAFVNTAQFALAMGWTSESAQWHASAVLWVAAAGLLLAAQRALCPSPSSLVAYSGAVLWGLVGVVIEQQVGALPGARASASVATALILVLCLHGLWLLRGVQQHARGGAG